jgi:hypothetical protein
MVMIMKMVEEVKLLVVYQQVDLVFLLHLDKFVNQLKVLVVMIC